MGQALVGQAGDPVTQLWRADSSVSLTELVGSQVEDETLSQNREEEENTTQPRPLTSYRALTHTGPGRWKRVDSLGLAGLRETPALPGLYGHPHAERRYKFFPLYSTS